MAPAESSPSQPTFTGEAALKLALQGRKAWNEWAENPSNAGRSVEFSGANLLDLATTGKDGGERIDFQGFIFPGALTFTNCIFSIRGNFANATFKGSADFQGATFEGSAHFQGATFKQSAVFYRATFKETADFQGATFEKSARFQDATFEESAHFSDTTFKELAIFFGATFQMNARFARASFLRTANFSQSIFEDVADFSGCEFTGPVILAKSQFCAGPPDFRNTLFKTHVTLHDMHVGTPSEHAGEHADRYRRLKELAATARDHDRAQAFFANEMRAKRGYETRGLARLPNWIYQVLSHYGKSLLRPALALLATWLVAAAVYFLLACGWCAVSRDSWRAAWETLAAALYYSALMLVPALPMSRPRLSALEDTLFGSDSLHLAVWIVSTLESVAGIVLLFLFGLALRNRFRI